MINPLDKYKSIYKIAKKYKFYGKPLKLKGWSEYCKNVVTFERNNLDSQTSYYILVDSINNAIKEKLHLPIVRLGDGELKLILGPKLPGKWWGKKKRFRLFLSYIKFTISLKKTYSRTKYSGVNTFSIKDARKFKELSINSFVEIAKRGIIAPHLSIAKEPFQADYISPFMEFYDRNFQFSKEKYSLTSFYYVYACLSEGLIFKAKRVTFLVSTRSLEEQNRIKQKFIYDYKAKEIKFVFLPMIETHNYSVNYDDYLNSDIILIGAGISKFIIMEKLKEVKKPIVDAGYMIEVWSKKSEHRPFCIS